MGHESATLFASTLHLFLDVFGTLASEPIAIFVDGGAYPIARWGAQHAMAQGVPTSHFPAREPQALRGRLAWCRRARLRPVVVTDGLCPFSGRAAPLEAYLELVRAYRGWLVVDDSQGLGILGAGSSTAKPLGHGGAGTLAWLGVEGPELVVGCSLAKGFGVPLAVLAGSQSLVERVESVGPCRVHCSPPSIAHIRAAAHALALNRDRGDELRQRLVRAIRRFRERMTVAGIKMAGDNFPVQTPDLGPAAEPIHARLLRMGIRTVLRKTEPSDSPALSFLLTASHSPWQIDRAVDTLIAIVADHASAGLSNGNKELKRPRSLT
jgi:8-amino-7-oxononanoate synthase